MEKLSWMLLFGIKNFNNNRINKTKASICAVCYPFPQRRAENLPNANCPPTKSTKREAGALLAENRVGYSACASRIDSPPFRRPQTWMVPRRWNVESKTKYNWYWRDLWLGGINNEVTTVTLAKGQMPSLFDIMSFMVMFTFWDCNNIVKKQW